MTADLIRYFISRGTPGKLMTAPPSVSTAKPGAVPTGFSMTAAAPRQKRLLAIVRGHSDAKTAKTLGYRIIKRLMELKLAMSRVGHSLPGHIIDRRSQSAAGNHNFGSIQGSADGIGNSFQIIANRGHQEYIDADVPQLTRHKDRIGVCNLAQEDLCSDGNDFRIWIV